MKFLSSILLILTGCAVEVGNPVDKDKAGGKTGFVNLEFAQVEDIFGESFKINIEKIELLTSDDSSIIIDDIAQELQSVELFSLTGEENSSPKISAPVAVNDYEEILIYLKSDKPLDHRDEHGAQVAIELDPELSTTMQFSDSFTIKENEENTIYVYLDPRRSLESSDNKKKFKPRGSLLPKHERASFESTTSLEGAKIVCAYMYLPKRPHHLREFKERPARKPHKVSPRPVFSDKQKLIKDDEKTCNNAFARIPVRDGKFKFRNLLPGVYDFRVFLEDGSYQDIEADTKIGAPKAQIRTRIR